MQYFDFPRNVPMPYAGGRSLVSPEQFGVIDPATEEVFAACPTSSPTDIDFAVCSARDAFLSFSKTSIEKRREFLLSCADLVRKKRDELAYLITREQGKPLRKARWEVEFSADWFDKIAKTVFPYNSTIEDEQCLLETRFEPVGVVAALVPWNFPVKLAVWKIAPVILTGNTIVIKPSPYTPLSTLRLVEILQEVLPPSVVNSVSGDSSVGNLLCNHPMVRLISFTGSPKNGQTIATSAIKTMKRFILELGGNDAAIVLSDVDVKKISERLFWSAFSNLGQTCTAIKRLYVSSNLHDQLISELCSIASGIRLADGFDPSADLGPVNNQQQLDRIMYLVQDATINSGQVVCGGARLNRRGYFFPPTIVTNLTEGVALVDEEQFGPVLPVLRYDDIDDAIERANNTKFGIGGSVWTNNPHSAKYVTEALYCGHCWINWHGPVMHSVPFGGKGISGFGYEHGLLGLMSLCSVKVVSQAQ